MGTPAGATDAGLQEPFIDHFAGGKVARHFHRLTGRIQVVNSDRSEKICLVENGMSGRQVGGAVDDVRVNPGTAADRVTDSHWCPARPSKPAGAWTAMQIDDDVEAFTTQLARDAQVISNP